jgi:diguanylate cyclase (GGDEF)-like protein/PAS domain S-box-containing protein
MRVLVVDDQEANRYLLRAIFEARGDAVGEAANGREALELLRAEPFEMVVADILMPVMDGYQLCREVRADAQLRRLFFVFYTATYVDQKDEALALRLGADRFFRKPMSPKELLCAIDDLVGGHAGEGNRAVPEESQADSETEILKLYNERLIQKLGHKVEELEREMLQRLLAEEALRTSEERYRSLVEQAADAIYIVSPDASILDVNPSACTILGYSADELVGRSFLDLVPPGDLAATPLQVREAAKGKAIVFERNLTRRDGTVVPVEISAKALDDGRIQGIARDVTERKRAEAALRESEERYALAAKGANDGLWDWNLRSGELYLSPRWKSMLGYEDGEVGTESEEWLGRVHPDDAEAVRGDLKAHLDGATPFFEHEHRVRHRDGSYRWMLTRGLAVRDETGASVRMVGSQTDVTNRKLAEEQLLHDAFHDQLTGLPNRALLLDRLSQAGERIKRAGSLPFALLHTGLDRFHVVNESLGHSVGDKVLETTAQRIEGCLRPGDTLARVGGDEFVVLTEDLKDVSDATRLVERITRELSQPILIGDQEVFVTASTGIVTSNGVAERPDDYLRDAHVALGRARTKGRGSVETFQAELHERVMSRLRLETALRHALERDEFEVYYQPVIDLEGDRLLGLEALVRWRHPERGILPPVEFLSVAEEAGFLVAIDRSVIGKACRQLRSWLDRYPALGHLTMSVNLSSRQFSEPDLVRFLETELQKSGLDPRHLHVEVTEGTLMESISRTRAVLTELRSMGVRLLIDDFGTGYSSLSYLQNFPIDTLKIDRSFVGQITSASSQAPIVQTIVALAENMGMRVLAEGVETAVQCTRIRSLRCQSAQGYLFSRPIDALQTEAVVLTRPSWGLAS